MVHISHGDCSCFNTSKKCALTRIARSLILHEVEKGQGQSTLVHLRFRGKVAAAGLKRRLLVWGGGVMDHLTTAPMLAGLAERAEASCDDRTKKSI